MRKLSQLTESVWGDIRKRSEGTEERKENVAAKLVIDGVKYFFAPDFWGIGETYKEENGEDWLAFGFNKMPNGSFVISGDTEVAGAFGRGKYDFDYDYDVYVLKDYFDHSAEELAERAIDDFQLYNADYSIQPILKKYVKDVFVNHMSDYAKFWIENLKDSDMDDTMVISICEGTHYNEIDLIKDEFEGREISDARLFLYPAFENWYEDLEKELIETYEKNGWTKSETYDVPYYDGLPAGTSGLCFVTFEDEE